MAIGTETKDGAGLEPFAVALDVAVTNTRKIAAGVRHFADALEKEAQERLAQANAQRNYAALLDDFAARQEALQAKITPERIAALSAIVTRGGC